MTADLARRGTIRAAERRAPAAFAKPGAAKSPTASRRPPVARLAHSWPIVDSLRIALPIPVSVNNAYLNVPGRGRIISGAYRAWREAASWIVAQARPGRIVGPYTLTLFLPETMRGDLDNRMKAASDLLVSLGVTDDDRHCRRSSAEKSSAIPKGECLVVIKAAGGEG